MSYKISKYNVGSNGQDIQELWGKVFPGVSPTRFAWIYKNNPHGQAECWVARRDGQQSLVGMISLFPRRLMISGVARRGAIAGDFAVDKQHRGFGPALALQRAAISSCNAGHYDCVYGIPLDQAKAVVQRSGYVSIGRGTRMTKLLNAQSYLRKRLNPILSNIVSPIINLMLKMGSKEIYCSNNKSFILEDLKGFDSRFDALWGKVSNRQRIMVERTSAYLNWRFFQCPHNSYELFGLVHGTDHELWGYVVGCTKDNCFWIADMLSADEESTLDIVIAKLLHVLRLRGLEAVSITYYGGQSFLGKLKRFGFCVRDQSSCLVAYAPPNTPLAGYIANIENWHLLPGDNDI